MKTTGEILASAILSVAGDWSNSALRDEELLEIIDYLAVLRHDELAKAREREEAALKKWREANP